MGNVKDMTGQTFGHLFVLKRDNGAPTGHGAFWICKCACGNITSVRGDSLRAGKTTSCGECDYVHKGSRPIVDITGQRFGKLTVIERSSDKLHKVGNGKQAIWKCKCDCGNITYVAGYDLRSGNTTSCGCNRGKTAENMTGNKYGRLTVIKRHYEYGETKWICRCECGNYSIVKASSLRSGAIKSCGKCGLRMSIGESIINDLLNKLNINFDYNHYFRNCVSPDCNVRLPFDFYLPDYNLCIEYDGKQHFEPVEWFGGEDTFKRQIFLDSVKNNYCSNNDIKLVRIPYTYNNEQIEQIILNNIQESRNDHSLEGNDQTYADNSCSLAS